MCIFVPAYAFSQTIPLHFYAPLCVCVRECIACVFLSDANPPTPHPNPPPQPPTYAN